MPYNNMRNNMNRGNNRNNNMRRPMRGGFDDEEIHPRQRKHAQNMREKYLNQARDAQINGDRVQAEYWLQHAEHYSRILNAINELFAPTHPQAGEEGADVASEEAMSGDMAAPFSEGEDPDANIPAPQAPRQHRQPRRPYQGQQEGGSQGAQDGQPGRGRGQWRQPREPRHADVVAPEATAPQDDLALPLAAVLPAARLEEDES
jgi:hypothetical protein